MAKRHVVGAVCVLLAAGCSSGDDSSEPTTEATTATTAAVTPPPATTAAAPITVAATEAPTTAAPATTATPAEQYDRDWEVGACFDIPANGNYATPVPLVDCAQPHDSEIFGTSDYAADAGAAFPGEDPLRAAASDVCESSYLQFTGFEADSGPIPYGSFTPDEHDWANGNHHIWCVASDPDGKMIGTVASAGLRAPNLLVVHLAITSDGSDLYLSQQGEVPSQLTTDEEAEQPYPPSIGGGQVAYYSRYPVGDTSQGDIVVFDNSTATVTPILATAADEGAPRISPDGTRIVFHSNAAGEGDFDIWVMNADGSDPTRLTTDAGREANPSWSPDGTKIIYRASDGDASNIWVMDADGSNRAQLTESGGDFDPMYSPDGTQIAFSSRRSGDFDIWLMNADGSNQLDLTNHPADDTYPMWTANGVGILFTSDRVSNHVWLMASDGSRQTLFTVQAPSGYGTPIGDSE